MILRLETTLADFDRLHASITARATAVKVPITTLNRLLVDHSRMVRMLASLGVHEVTAATSGHRLPGAQNGK